MRLYHSEDTRSFRALWALEEVGATYDLVTMAFPPRLTDPGYLSENPLGTVPLLVDGDTRMTESAAICQYLANRYPAASLAVDVRDERYGEYLDALHYGEATLTFPQAVYLRYAVFEPEARRSPQVAEDYRLWFHARLRWLDGRLESSSYAVGDRFTAADISVGYALMLARRFGIEEGASLRLQAYLDRLSARPAFLRAKARQTEPSSGT